MAVSSRATSSGSNTRMSVRRGRASSATAHPAPRRWPRAAPIQTVARPETNPARSPRPAPCAGRREVRENGPVLLDEVAETSAAVAASSARLAKVERLGPACGDWSRRRSTRRWPSSPGSSGSARSVGWATLRSAPDPAAPRR